MKTDQIRESYLEFFEKKNHKRIASDSLVPQNDPSLLFTGAGMNQFKDYFLGLKKDLKRATSSQKCLRTGDLEEVGKTAFHHSFFEMLGNFSFGDYFKEEAITWAWEYLTKILKISPSRLRISVHHQDDEALSFWRDKIGIRENWIYRLKDKSNFWPANAPMDGPNGPCGPCSEIYFDQDPTNPSEDIESSRFAEIWNLVFTQYDRQGVNQLVPLAQKNIDTGMGLERLACVLQGKSTNYEIDIFQPLNRWIEKSLSITVPDKDRRSLYAISDHARAAVFAIADGVVPSNEGRGYVIRKVIRRALWHAHQLSPSKKVEAPFLFETLTPIVAAMGKSYPEIPSAAESIAATIKGEEERFLATLESGLSILQNRLEKLRSKKEKTVSGDLLFELYDTYGFPEELTQSIAKEQGFQIDTQAFTRLMEEQRKRAKESTQIASSIFTTGKYDVQLADLPETQFLGYDATETKAKVLFSQKDGDKSLIVLTQSPFYGESGGQVGDQGTFTAPHANGVVVDTQKKGPLILHIVETQQGEFKVGDSVIAKIDVARRLKTMRNHTATHLLHAALRQILGPQTRQLGSLVSPEKLRFDYASSKPLAPEQIGEIESLVNKQILDSISVTKEEKKLDDAKKDGAIAFFGEKYGDKVRVVSVPGFSKELCGGTHCQSTGQIGLFAILSDSSVASGTRRIEAVTGEGAQEYLQSLRGQMNEVAQLLKVSPSDVVSRLSKLQEAVKKLEKEKKQGVTSSLNPKQILEKAQTAGSFILVSFYEKELEMDQLRTLADQLKSAKSQLVFCLASENDKKIQVLMGSSPDLKQAGFDTRKLFQEAADLLGATGGGRPDLVQAGGRNVGQLSKNWSKITEQLISYLTRLHLAKK